MKTLVILRPEPGASATLERAEALSLKAIKVPLFSIEPIDWTVPVAATFDRIVFTSANALRAGGPGLQSVVSLPAACVGEATARAARKAGFLVDMVGSEGIEALLDALGDDNILHLCGEHRTAHGRQITEIPVYRSRAVDQPDGLEGIAGNVVLVHSQRAARRAAELVARKGSVTLAAMNLKIAAAAGPGWKSVHVADRYSDDRLLALAKMLCQGSEP